MQSRKRWAPTRPYADGAVRLLTEELDTREARMGNGHDETRKSAARLIELLEAMGSSTTAVRARFPRRAVGHYVVEM